MTSKPEPVADERLLHAHDLALAALHEITPAETVGPAAGHVVEADDVVSLRFHTRLAGYPGWYWTVTVALVEDSEPTVLEAELLPGDGALLAPDWVPWAQRLAEYQAAQAAAAAAGDEADDELADDLDDDDLDDDDDVEDDDADDESDDEDDEPKARLHAGDLDGVDIDELDESAGASDDEDDADDDDSEDDDSEDDDAEDDDDPDGDDDERERSY
ncbi:MAG: DUF3027 domain-containing protein [Microbacterium sp.]|uniref:DUF3027 domain-containing protein n=1 Tax=Microbacterium sp. TaxID=51671 RepID=UPI0025CE741F|nr:DUF3027 domain-containing protein [Microbacterium sp.]MBQ9916751.1 DUF3027 domain-containing protein [Microbacterium sp.]